MTVKQLIALLQAHNQTATICLWNPRYDLASDTIPNIGDSFFGVEEVTTFPGNPGVFIIETYEYTQFK